jgi:hypothetical protein
MEMNRTLGPAGLPSGFGGMSSAAPLKANTAVITTAAKAHTVLIPLLAIMIRFSSVVKPFARLFARITNVISRIGKVGVYAGRLQLLR